MSEFQAIEYMTSEQLGFKVTADFEDIEVS